MAGMGANPMAGMGANPMAGMNPGMMGGFNPQMMQQMMGNYGGMGAMPTAPADTRPPRERFAAELAQVKEMGFHDEETILQMLVQCNGNVSLALERLFTLLG